MPLWLIGMMGSGKTTVGQAIAHRRNAPFLDTDRIVEDTTGLAIEHLFAKEGESGFRQREREAVLTAASQAGAVVATGGGVVSSEENVALMKSSGTIVWLRASVDTLADRLESVNDRPLLTDSDRRKTLAEILDKRQELYAEAADFMIDTDFLAPTEAVILIEAMWTD